MQKSVTWSILTAVIFIISFLFLIMCIVYGTPYTYVSVDINPGVEFTTNMLGYVIEESGTNEDGEKLILNKSFNNESIQEAVTQFVVEASKSGYISQTVTNNTVLVTVLGDEVKNLTKIEEKINKNLNEFFKQNQIIATIINQQEDSEVRDMADQNGISIGKMKLAERACTLNSELDINNVAKLPIRDIIGSINESIKNDY